MHNTWMCGQMRLLATCLALSRVPIVCTEVWPVGTSPHTTEHGYSIDSNAPLLGHLIDAGAMGRQTTTNRR